MKATFIQEVDAHLIQNGKEELIIKMDKKEKQLYYENTLNPNNRFLGEIEFPSVMLSRDLNLLCNTDERKELFMTKFLKKNLFMSIMNFRDYMKAEGRGKTQLKELVHLIMKNDNNELHNALQELFLEPIDIKVFTRLREELNDGLTPQEILKWREDDQGGLMGLVVTMRSRYVNGEWISKKKFKGLYVSICRLK